MTARGAEPLSEETVARVVKMLAEMGRVALEAQGAFETNIVFEVLKIEPRPGRASDTERRFAVTVTLIGPLPTTEQVFWDWVPQGAEIPYQVGQQYRLTVTPV